MFLRGKLCELAPLEGTEKQVKRFANAVNAGLTTKHMLTGSIPMRQIDVKKIWDKNREQGDIEFAILNEGCFVGTCGLYAHRDIYRSWEFRILIFEPSALGRGIGTEATILTVKYAFDRLNANRVWLGVNAENLGAIKCYEKAGFKHEGTLEEELYCFGHYVNAERYGMTRKRWASIAQ